MEAPIPCQCGPGCECTGTKGGSCPCGCAKPPNDVGCQCGEGCSCAGTKGFACDCKKDEVKVHTGASAITSGACACGPTCDCAGTKGGTCECGQSAQAAAGSCTCGPACDCAGTKGGVCGCAKPAEAAEACGCSCGSACDCAGTKGGVCACPKESKDSNCESGCGSGESGTNQTGCCCGPACDCAGTKGGTCCCPKPKPRLIYFNQRGRAEVIRLMLAEAKVDYVDCRFPENDPSESHLPNKAFEEMRATGCLEWDQVPAFEVDGQVIVQSRAIERYIACRYGLVSKDPIEAAHADSVCEALADVSLALQRILTGTEESKQEAMRDFVDVQLPKWGALFEAKLTRCGTGYYGKSCSYADISAYYLWNMINQHSAGYALKLFPAIKAHTVLIGNRPAIKAWVASRPKTQF